MPERTPKPEPTRQYIMSEKQLRLATVYGTIGMVALVLVILLLATARPRGSFKPLDRSVFQASLDRATADLEGYALLGDGRARIDINAAMALVVERGVAGLTMSATAAAPAAAAPTSTGADTADAGPSAQAAATADGDAVYQANCAACHQATGQGIPGAFPPLAGHLPELYAVDREFPILTILFGLMGPIEVHGQSYNGMMPAWGHLSDDELAAVLDHILSSWGNADALPADFTPYTAEDIASHRDRGLSSADVHELRGTLDLSN